MAYQVVKKKRGSEDILGVFPRREHAEIFRDAYARMSSSWIVLEVAGDKIILYDQEADETVVLSIR